MKFNQQQQQTKQCSRCTFILSFNIIEIGVLFFINIKCVEEKKQNFHDASFVFEIFFHLFHFITKKKKNLEKYLTI